MATPPKIRDLSFLLPAAGTVLLLSPIIQAFNSARLVWGVPVIVLYIFGVWLGLILLGRWLSRYQRETHATDVDTSASIGSTAPPGRPRPDDGS